MNNIKILYAEDEPSNRELMHIKLINAGFSCDLAENGALTLKMFKKKNYNLIILDHYLPDMNSIEIYREIKKTNPDIPIICITSDDEMKTELLKSGYNAVFIKPIRGDNIITTINSLLKANNN